jgi:hypothetical protein
MARPGPASFTKRKRETDKRAKREAKMAQRAERRALKAQRPPRVDGQDPDLAGIRPGPQPPRQY